MTPVYSLGVRPLFQFTRSYSISNRIRFRSYSISDSMWSQSGFELEPNSSPTKIFTASPPSVRLFARIFYNFILHTYKRRKILTIFIQFRDAFLFRLYSTFQSARACWRWACFGSPFNFNKEINIFRARGSNGPSLL